MVCSWRLEGLTPPTPSLTTASLIRLELLTIRRRPSFRDMSRVYRAGPVVAYPDAGSKNIDSPYFILGERRFLKI